MIDNIRAIAIFAETLRQGSFRAAAAHLGLSPSAVSTNISELEKRLGTALLYRSTRKLAPTDAGERLFAHANRMLASAEQGLADITTNGGALRGRLRLTLPSGLIRAGCNRRIAEFSRLHPDLQLHITYTDERQDLIGQGIDLAIRAGDMDDSSLKSTRIGTIERQLVCSPAFLADNPTPKTPQDLAGMDWIHLEMMPKTKLFRHARQGETSVQMQGNVTVNSIEAVTRMCLHGVGLATPPDYLVLDEIAAGRLTALLPDWQVSPIPVFAVRPGNAVPNRNASALVAYLRND